MRTIITGATGLIGRRLVAATGAAETTVLSRDPRSAERSVRAARFVGWDGASTIDPSVFERAEVVYHLAGEPVAEGRWSADKKRKIRESRREGTRAVAQAIARSGSRATLVSASAVGYYGSRGDEVLTEESAPGEGFLPDVCKAWEAEAEAAAASGSRVVTIRVGIVLARDGGALARMVPIFRTGLAGRLGDGEQWMPWIHVDDAVSLFRYAGATRALSGPVNAAAPNPVTNRELTKTLARALHRPAVIPAPSFALRAVLGELADVVLSSQRVVPRRALREGFSFRHGHLTDALSDLVGEAPKHVATTIKEMP